MADELEKAGARHSKSDMAMFDKVMSTMDEMKQIIASLRGGMDEEQPEKGEEEVEKRDVDPNVGGGVDRDKLKDSDFVDSANRRFPIVSAGDVMDAVHSYGRMGSPKMPFEEFKSKLTALARRKGFEGSLPKSWGDEVKKSMGLMTFMQKVRQAFEGNQTEPNPENFIFVHDVLMEGALIQTQKGYFIAPFSFDGDVVIPSSEAEWVEAEQEWHPKETHNGIFKSSEEKQLIYGVVLKPEPFVDTQNDIVTRDEIEKAAHDYMENYRRYDEQHQKDVKDGDVVPVESYIAPTDIVYKGKLIPEGSWIVVSHVKDNELWKSVKNGKIKAYSIAGYCAKREKAGE